MSESLYAVDDRCQWKSAVSGSLLTSKGSTQAHLAAIFAVWSPGNVNKLKEGERQRQRQTETKTDRQRKKRVSE